MRQYSIAKVVQDHGIASEITALTTVKAHDYEDAINKAFRKLKLKKGDTLSIIALQGRQPSTKGLELPGRYEVNC